MSFPLEIICYPIVERIFSIDRILVRVKRRSQKLKYSPDPADYKYSKAAPRKMSVGQWKEKRFERYFPELHASVLDKQMNPLPDGTQLADAEHVSIHRYRCIYFADLYASLKFSSEQLAEEAKNRLKHSGIESSLEDTSFLFWKSYEVRPQINSAVLTRKQSCRLETYLEDIAEELDGSVQLGWSKNRFMDVPFDESHVQTNIGNLIPTLDANKGV